VAFLSAKSVRIVGISAAVPKQVEEVRSLTNLFTPDETEKFIA
jgi:hypothetical protein